MKRSQIKRKSRLRAKGGHRFPKAVDQAYRWWIAERPCVVAGCATPRPTVPAHYKARGAGGPDHGNLFPACPIHHNEQHRIGVVSFQTKYALDLEAITTRLWQEYQENA